MSADQPFGLLGDLTEALVPIAVDLAVKSHDDGPEKIRHTLIRVQDIESDLAPELREQLAYTPGGIWGVFATVCAAMVNPDAGMKELLGWTEPLVSLHVLQSETERLRLAGVRTRDAAVTLAKGAATQETVKDRMLRVNDNRKATA